MQINILEEQTSVNTPVRRGQPPQGYYTATTAKQKLGNISDGMLRTYVQNGSIERITPAGRKQGFYKRADVDRLARSFDNLPIDKTERTGTRFRRATRDDIPACVELLIKIFGGGNATEKRQAWIDKNPEVAYVVESKSKIVACAFVLPLKPEKIDTIFEDQSNASIRQIVADDIQQFTPGEEMYLYVVSLGVQPGSQLAKRLRGEILVRGLLKQFIRWGEQGIQIKLITGRSDLRDGINLMKHIGFAEIESHTDNRNFVIEVERSGISYIMLYKKALAEWKQKHEGNGI